MRVKINKWDAIATKNKELRVKRQANKILNKIDSDR